MGRNESTVELLVKVWEGIREFLEVPNESTGFFFRHMRVLRFKGRFEGRSAVKLTTEISKYYYAQILRSRPPAVGQVRFPIFFRTPSKPSNGRPGLGQCKGN